MKEDFLERPRDPIRLSGGQGKASKLGMEDRH